MAGFQHLANLGFSKIFEYFLQIIVYKLLFVSFIISKSHTVYKHWAILLSRFWPSVIKNPDLPIRSHNKPVWHQQNSFSACSNVQKRHSEENTHTHTLTHIHNFFTSSWSVWYTVCEISSFMNKGIRETSKMYRLLLVLPVQNTTCWGPLGALALKLSSLFA